jgi:single-strand DNA-binding protein
MLTKTMRLGRDAELKNGNGGDFVSLSLAYNVGFGENKRTVWVSATWFGKQAIGAQQYLLKGSQVTVSLRDVEPNLYNEKVSLRGIVSELDFVGQKSEQSQQAPKKATPPSFENLDDDALPF